MIRQAREQIARPGEDAPHALPQVDVGKRPRVELAASPAGLVAYGDGVLVAMGKIGTSPQRIISKRTKLRYSPVWLAAGVWVITPR